MAIPTQDSLLADFSTNFEERIVANPTDYGLVAAQATAYTAVHDPFIAAYAAVVAAREAGTRSSSLVATKDAAKLALLSYARQLYSFVQSSLTVTDARKIELGVRVKDVTPTPVPAPGSAPGIAILSTVANTVRVRLFDPVDPTRRAKPLGVDGASVFSFVGASAPAEMSGWTFEGNTTRTTVDIVFPAATAPGAKVWFTAFWFNPRAQKGPAATAVGTNIPGGSAMAA